MNRAQLGLFEDSLFSVGEIRGLAVDVELVARRIDGLADGQDRALVLNLIRKLRRIGRLATESQVEAVALTGYAYWREGPMIVDKKTLTWVKDVIVLPLLARLIARHGWRCWRPRSRLNEGGER